MNRTVAASSVMASASIRNAGAAAVSRGPNAMRSTWLGARAAQGDQDDGGNRDDREHDAELAQGVLAGVAPRRRLGQQEAGEHEGGEHQRLAGDRDRRVATGVTGCLASEQHDVEVLQDGEQGERDQRARAGRWPGCGARGAARWWSAGAARHVGRGLSGAAGAGSD